ncbi:TetR/AcrR family transcriptional regulator [bacterium]|nr:MAG: TetR/AcrR family transcriptional regulator [bacterium]
MARPKAFDREKALQAAMAIFWSRGYEATSTDDLIKGMGIGRQSLYDTFGDKHKLYLEALQMYNANSIAGYIETIRGTASPMAAIEEILLSMALDSSETRAFGCMGINATCEFGQNDAKVNAVLQSSGVTMLSILEQALNEAKAKGEMPDTLDTRKAARFLNSTLAGMKVGARGGEDADTLRDVASFALNSLRIR